MTECVGGLDGRSPSWVEQPRRDVMVEPEVVSPLLRLRALGWGSIRRQIRREDLAHVNALAKLVRLRERSTLCLDWKICQ
jgi:hypothetical protein